MKYTHGSDVWQTFSSIVQVPKFKCPVQTHTIFCLIPEKVRELFGTDLKEMFTDDSLKISSITSLILNK